MNTRFNTTRLLFASFALTALAPFALAGPGQQYFTQAKPITTFTEASAVGPEDLVTMQCKGCKTVMIHGAKRTGRPAGGRTELLAVGSKHTCTECKGEITVVKGKTTDSMQHNCTTCGEGSVTCCVVAMEKK